MVTAPLHTLTTGCHIRESRHERKCQCRTSIRHTANYLRCPFPECTERIRPGSHASRHRRRAVRGLRTARLGHDRLPPGLWHRDPVLRPVGRPLRRETAVHPGIESFRARFTGVCVGAGFRSPAPWQNYPGQRRRRRSRPRDDTGQPSLRAGFQRQGPRDSGGNNRWSLRHRSPAGRRTVRIIGLGIHLLHQLRIDSAGSVGVANPAIGRNSFRRQRRHLGRHGIGSGGGGRVARAVGLGTIRLEFLPCSHRCFGVRHRSRRAVLSADSGRFPVHPQGAPAESSIRSVGGYQLHGDGCQFGYADRRPHRGCGNPRPHRNAGGFGDVARRSLQRGIRCVGGTRHGSLGRTAGPCCWAHR